MGKKNRNRPALPADRRILREELLAKYSSWWAAGLDVDFVVDQCYRDFNYLHKIEKMNAQDSKKPFAGGENLDVKPIYKLSPGDAEYEEEMKKAEKNNQQVLKSYAEKYDPNIKEGNERNIRLDITDQRQEGSDSLSEPDSPEEHNETSQSDSDSA